MNFYPAAPVTVSPEKLQPSAGFKSQVKKVILSISIFFVAYIVMVALSIALAIACVYGGIAIVVAIPKLITILLGIGLIALGVSVFFFLVKFIFAVSKDVKESRVQITEAEQPELFDFIRRISQETQTPFPRKIFLSPDVNACVFYNSSFWSMFLPVRKNLEIGLGLVNSINLSELKAVIAHEFGHFSQRSMKLGSFTYNVNRVIFNMLYENQGYNSFLQGWGNISGEIAIFAVLTVRIASFIQWILRGFYKLVNKNYMGLSREMEFHADAIAASVSGGNNLVSALSRLEVASGCYQTAINKANETYTKKKLAKNIFSNQLSAYHQFAKDYQLPVKNNMPEISVSFIESFSRSRINFQNQWASHPTLAERKEHLEKLEMDCDASDHSAWVVFRDQEQLQEKMTSNLYSHIEADHSSFEYYDNKSFSDMLASDAEKYSLPEVYNGYYDKRFIESENWDLDQLSQQESTTSFHQLFNNNNQQLQASIDVLKRDIETVTSIKNKEIDTTTFDFDGTKYDHDQCDEVITILEKELADHKAQLQELDKQAFILFSSTTPSIKEDYRKHQAISKERHKFMEIVEKVFTTIGPLYQGAVTVEQVNAIVSTLKGEHEPSLKKFLNAWLDSGRTFSEGEEEFRKLLVGFIQSQYRYFDTPQILNNEFDHLRTVIAEMGEKLDDELYAAYKKMLVNQLKNYNNN